MKIKHLTLALCLLTGFTFASAQSTDAPGKDYNPIITSVPSLSIAPDAAATGMGDVGAATDASVNSQYWNPSKYAFIEDEAGFAMSYTPWLSQLVSDIDLAYLTGYMKLDDMQALSASLRYFSLGEVILRESLGDVGYAIQPYEMAIDMAYSRLLSRNLSMSVALRYIYSDLMSADDPAGQAFAADISAYYKKPVYFGR
ncbi:MAG: PorV/PorQ family protein, partial [Bacteroidales bacterium]|nr:PorV/PorQ family protein [Bacteroidales bacterium]